MPAASYSIQVTSLPAAGSSAVAMAGAWWSSPAGGNNPPPPPPLSISLSLSLFLYVTLSVNGLPPQGNAALIEVSPGANHVLQGFIRTNCGAEGAVSIRATYSRFDLSPSTLSPNATLLQLPSTAVGCPGWEPLMLGLTVPGDGARVVLHFEAAHGATLSLYSLSLQ